MIKYGLVDLEQYDRSLVIDLKYATDDNFVDQTVYPEARAFLLEPAAQVLKNVQSDLIKQGYSLKILDAYRPFSVQERLWSLCPNGDYLSEPIREGNSMVHGSRHSRGAAVDVTLINLSSGEELEMPSAFDEFSSRAHREYSHCSAAVKENISRLEQAMLAHDFVGLPHEWWHFDYIHWSKYPLLDIPFWK